MTRVRTFAISASICSSALPSGIAVRVETPVLVSGGQRDTQPPESLKRVVVQASRDPAPFSLLAFEEPLDRLAADSLDQLDRECGPVRERLGEAQVDVGEAWIAAQLVPRRDHREHPLAHDQGNDEGRGGGDDARRGLVDLGIVDDRVDPLAPPVPQRLAHPRAGRPRPASRAHLPGRLRLRPRPRAPGRLPAGRATIAPRAPRSSHRRAAVRARGAMRAPARAPGLVRPRSATRAATTSAGPTRTTARSRSRPRPGRRGRERSLRPRRRTPRPCR